MVHIVSGDHDVSIDAGQVVDSSIRRSSVRNVPAGFGDRAFRHDDGPVVRGHVHRTAGPGGHIPLVGLIHDVAVDGDYPRGGGDRPVDEHGPGTRCQGDIAALGGHVTVHGEVRGRGAHDITGHAGQVEEGGVHRGGVGDVPAGGGAGAFRHGDGSVIGGHSHRTAGPGGHIPLIGLAHDVAGDGDYPVGGGDSAVNEHGPAGGGQGDVAPLSDHVTVHGEVPHGYAHDVTGHAGHVKEGRIHRSLVGDVPAGGGAGVGGHGDGAGVGDHVNRAADPGGGNVPVGALGHAVGADQDGAVRRLKQGVDIDAALADFQGDVAAVGLDPGAYVQIPLVNRDGDVAIGDLHAVSGHGQVVHVVDVDVAGARVVCLDAVGVDLDGVAVADTALRLQHGVAAGGDVGAPAGQQVADGAARRGHDSDGAGGAFHQGQAHVTLLAIHRDVTGVGADDHPGVHGEPAAVGGHIDLTGAGSHDVGAALKTNAVTGKIDVTVDGLNRHAQAQGLAGHQDDLAVAAHLQDGAQDDVVRPTDRHLPGFVVLGDPGQDHVAGGVHVDIAGGVKVELGRVDIPGDAAAGSQGDLGVIAGGGDGAGDVQVAARVQIDGAGAADAGYVQVEVGLDGDIAAVQIAGAHREVLTALVDVYVIAGLALGDVQEPDAGQKLDVVGGDDVQVPGREQTAGDDPRSGGESDGAAPGVDGGHDEDVLAGLQVEAGQVIGGSHHQEGPGDVQVDTAALVGGDEQVIAGHLLRGDRPLGHGGVALGQTPGGRRIDHLYLITIG